LNSPPPPFLTFFPSFEKQFQQVFFFCLFSCVHSICTIFTPHPIGTNPPRLDLFFLFSHFVKEMTFLLVLNSYTGNFLVALPCIIAWFGSSPIFSFFLLSFLYFSSL
jgi:hypothetical protein